MHNAQGPPIIKCVVIYMRTTVLGVCRAPACAPYLELGGWVGEGEPEGAVSMEGRAWALPPAEARASRESTCGFTYGVVSGWRMGGMAVSAWAGSP